jgi:hypothetical protein
MADCQNRGIRQAVQKTPLEVFDLKSELIWDVSALTLDHKVS